MQSSKAAALAGDPRRPDEVLKFKRRLVAPDQKTPDVSLIVGVLLAMGGVFLKNKYLAFAALLFCLSALLTATPESSDPKVFISGFTAAGMGLFSSYAAAKAKPASAAQPTAGG